MKEKKSIKRFIYFLGGLKMRRDKPGRADLKQRRNILSRLDYDTAFDN